MTRESNRSSNDVVYENNRKFTTKIDYVSGTNPIYVGLARAGTLTSESFWQIIKLTWDGNDNPTDVKYADSSTKFEKEFDERASYTYA